MTKDLKRKLELTSGQLMYLHYQLQKIYPYIVGEAMAINENPRYLKKYKKLVMKNVDIFFNVMEELEQEADFLLKIEEIDFA